MEYFDCGSNCVNISEVTISKKVFDLVRALNNNSLSIFIELSILGFILASAFNWLFHLTEWAFFGSTLSKEYRTLLKLMDKERLLYAA